MSRRFHELQHTYFCRKSMTGVLIVFWLLFKEFSYREMCEPKDIQTIVENYKVLAKVENVFLLKVLRAKKQIPSHCYPEFIVFHLPAST